MKNLILFDSTKAYYFGMNMEETAEHQTKASHVADYLSNDEKEILFQVIQHGKIALWSRFSDFMYGKEKASPHYKFKLQGEASAKHKEMVKKHHLLSADLPEYMEDMIRESTFVRTEPLCVSRKTGIWKTVFVFRDRVDFEESGEKENIELRFALNKIINGMYEMEILAFGYPIPKKTKPEKEKKASHGKKVTFWRVA